jgi:hypothetical protein
MKQYFKQEKKLKNKSFGLKVQINFTTPFPSSKNV